MILSVFVNHIVLHGIILARQTVTDTGMTAIYPGITVAHPVIRFLTGAKSLFMQMIRVGML